MSFHRWISAARTRTASGLRLTPAFIGAIGLCLIHSAPLQAQDVQAPKPKLAKAKTAAKPAAEADGSEAGDAKVAKKRDPAEVARAVETGIKLLESGKTEPAIQTLSSAISGGNLPPSLMARALHHRGIAYRKASKPAQAISDLTSALWVKGGLNDADKADATQQRASAYRDAGLPDQTDGDGRPAGVVRNTRTAETAQTARSPAPVATASLAPDSGTATASPIGNLFAGLFGGGAVSRPAQAVAEPSPVVAPTATTSGWSSATAAKAVPAPKAAVATPVAAPVKAPIVTAALAPATAAPAGGIHARIALVQTPIEAESVVERLKGQFAAQLGARTPAVSQTQVGTMGTFYQVRVGPFASKADADQLCKQIKAGKGGLDCVSVDR